MIEHSSLTDKQKRTIYRAQHRGTKEMDWMLGKYVVDNVSAMDDAALDLFDKLMSFPEPVIDGWLLGKTDDIPSEFTGLIAAIQEFHDL